MVSTSDCTVSIFDAAGIAATSVCTVGTDVLAAGSVVVAMVKAMVAVLLYPSAVAITVNGASTMFDGGPTAESTDAIPALSGALAWLSDIAATPVVAETME